ncbi:hypothetical protein BH09ACT10_BH09ACT10_05470 [soil metagenome]
MFVDYSLTSTPASWMHAASSWEALPSSLPFAMSTPRLMHGARVARRDVNAQLHRLRLRDIAGGVGDKKFYQLTRMTEVREMTSVDLVDVDA